jgi:hypothetical protein
VRRSGIARRGGRVYLVCLVYSVCPVSRTGKPNQTNQRDQIDLMNKTDESYAALEAAFSKSS